MFLDVTLDKPFRCTMCWYRLLVVLLVAHSHASVVAQLLWDIPTQKFFLVPGALPRKALIPSRAAVSPLTIKPRVGTWSSAETPYFTARPDRTLAWTATNLCLDASVSGGEHIVRMRPCTSRPNQLWDILPCGREGNRRIQLRGTTKCLGVRPDDGVSHEAPVELRQCDDVLTQSWKFEDPIQHVQNVAQRPTSAFVVRVVLLVMISVGVLGPSWLWLWRRTTRTITVNQRSGTDDQGGVCLTSAVLTISPLSDDDDDARRTRKPLASLLHPKLKSPMLKIASLYKSEQLHKIPDALRKKGVFRPRKEGGSRLRNPFDVWNGRKGDAADSPNNSDIELGQSDESIWYKRFEDEFNSTVEGFKTKNQRFVEGYLQPKANHQSSMRRYFQDQLHVLKFWSLVTFDMPDPMDIPDPESGELPEDANQTSLAWDQDSFDPKQNTIFIDVDDTVISAGSNFVAGMDCENNQASRMIPEDEIKARHEVYHGVLEFINLVSCGQLHNQGRVATTGNVFVTSARPHMFGEKLIKLFHETLQQQQPERLYRNPVGWLWGSKKRGVSLLRSICSRWQLEKLKLTVPLEQREKIKRKYESLGDFKVLGIKQTVREIEASYPEYRQSSPEEISHETDRAQLGPGLLFFLGDNGQGDFSAGLKLLRENVVDYVFIHDVRNLKTALAAGWIDHDPEAAGVELYHQCSQDVRDRMILFRDYREAARLVRAKVGKQNV